MSRSEEHSPVAKSSLSRGEWITGLSHIQSPEMKAETGLSITDLSRRETSRIKVDSPVFSLPLIGGNSPKSNSPSQLDFHRIFPMFQGGTLLDFG